MDGYPTRIYDRDNFRVARIPGGIRQETANLPEVDFLTSHLAGVAYENQSSQDLRLGSPFEWTIAQ